MVPFYGQGMNSGLEDVRVLFSHLDSHPSRSSALLAYSAERSIDAHAINDLALQNYTEMRDSVTSPVYKARKWLEEKLSVWVPGLGWTTKYSRVSFGNERYSEVVRRSERQGRLLVVGLAGFISAPLMVGAVGLWWRWRRWGRGS
jgi:kynurenine 3-monooxygenase